MATIGSLGDLHPYIALALEMRKRYIEPVIATSNTYRERIESLNIEFQEIRPAMPEPGTPEYLKMHDGVMDPNRGAEYLFKRILVPAVRDMYTDLREAIYGADASDRSGWTTGRTEDRHSVGFYRAGAGIAVLGVDPWVPPNTPWLHRVLKALTTMSRWRRSQRCRATR